MKRELTWPERVALRVHGDAHHVPGDALWRAEFYLTRGHTDDVDTAVEWGIQWLRNLEEQAARRADHATGATRFVRDEYEKPVITKRVGPPRPTNPYRSDP